MSNGNKKIKGSKDNAKKNSSSSKNVLFFVIFLFIALAVERFYSSKGKDENGSDYSSKGEQTPVNHPIHVPTDRPSYENDYKDWTALETDPEWLKDLSGEFQVKRWLSPTEEHFNPNIRQLPQDLNNWNVPLGHMGSGVEIGDMSGESETIRDAKFHQNYFEEFISDLIPLDRELPDWRGQYCKDNYDKDLDTLKPTSIIICFHNEAWSTLLRSVHSILNRTPSELLTEILLVDDFSTLDHLKTPLDEYVQSHFDKVRVIHLKERHGLIRSRMVGVRESKSEILTFLDSHIEVSIGWIEPLLHRIKLNPKTIISPVIDSINATTFYYHFIYKDIYGLMNWDLDFEWRDLGNEARSRKPDIWAPHRNPIMAGGLFSIDKSWFEQLGYYDEGMTVWGGENYELSFKAWMCGGVIEISPCSRVGHIFRSHSPYRVTPDDVHKNGHRVAEVWMDEYKYLYFDRKGNFNAPSNKRLIDFGDVSSRKELRKKLKCKSFRWFLTHIAEQQLPAHNLIGAGEIKNEATNLCVDKNDRMTFLHHPVDLIPCHNLGGHQYWWLVENKFILRDYACLGFANGRIIIEDCRKGLKWEYNPEQKSFKASNGRCLAIQSENVLTLTSCDPSNPNQRWSFTKYNPQGLKYKQLL